MGPASQARGSCHILLETEPDPVLGCTLGCLGPPHESLALQPGRNLVTVLFLKVTGAGSANWLLVGSSPAQMSLPARLGRELPSLDPAGPRLASVTVAADWSLSDGSPSWGCASWADCRRATEGEGVAWGRTSLAGLSVGQGGGCRP